MTRGPRLKIVRRLRTPLPGLTRKSADARPYPPGQHGQSRVRRRTSDYRRRLEEKQKVRAHYGISESQLRRALGDTAGEPGIHGENMLVRFERRLDNVVFRLGFAPTIPAARQLVVHGHVHVNGRRVDRPGFLTAPGHVIAIAERMCESSAVLDSLERGPAVALPNYLEKRGDTRCVGTVVGPPVRAHIPILVDEAAIVEFYAR